MDVANEIKEIKSMLERIEAIIDARLVGVAEPEEDEVAEIRDYMKRKKEVLSFTKYRVFLESKAEKQLRKLTQEDRERVLERIQKLKEGLLPELDVKKLRGYKDQFRLSWRV